jgi:hypothetical protein
MQFGASLKNSESHVTNQEYANIMDITQLVQNMCNDLLWYDQKVQDSINMADKDDVPVYMTETLTRACYLIINLRERMLSNKLPDSFLKWGPLQQLLEVMDNIFIRSFQTACDLIPFKRIHRTSPCSDWVQVCYSIQQIITNRKEFLPSLEAKLNNLQLQKYWACRKAIEVNISCAESSQLLEHLQRNGVVPIKQKSLYNTISTTEVFLNNISWSRMLYNMPQENEQELSETSDTEKPGEMTPPCEVDQFFCSIKEDVAQLKESVLWDDTLLQQIMLLVHPLINTDSDRLRGTKLIESSTMESITGVCFSTEASTGFGIESFSRDLLPDIAVSNHKNKIIKLINFLKKGTNERLLQYKIRLSSCLILWEEPPDSDILEYLSSRTPSFITYRGIGEPVIDIIVDQAATHMEAFWFYGLLFEQELAAMDQQKTPNPCVESSPDLLVKFRKKRKFGDI